MTAPAAALAFCLLALMLHLASIALAATRMRGGRRVLPPREAAPPVTIIRPLCGIEPFSALTLASSFALDYPRYELIFCVAAADDPAIAIVEPLMASHPHVAARLLVGEERVSLNPKLNNLVKGWETARHDWTILADSNVLMPRDAVQRLMARWRPDTGAVCSVPIGARPANFWAELECAFLNSFEARWEYAADTLGYGFAQGKSMLVRRGVIERLGGIRALGAEIAEDAALTKLLHAAGLKIRLVDNPFEQPLGYRRASEVLARQRRWSRLRRITFPLLYLPELLVGCFFPLIAAVYAGTGAGTMALLGGIWLGAEAMLTRFAGWHWSPRLLVAYLLRDLLLPFLWLDAWAGSSFVWRGTAMKPRRMPRRPFRPVLGVFRTVTRKWFDFPVARPK